MVRANNALRGRGSRTYALTDLCFGLLCGASGRNKKVSNVRSRQGGRSHLHAVVEFVRIGTLLRGICDIYSLRIEGRT
jgi:hypothetical protein